MLSLWDEGFGTGGDNVAIFMESRSPHIKDLKGNQLTFFFCPKNRIM